jgi:hypothetical protein
MLRLLATVGWWDKNGTALNLVRANDVIYHEELRVNNTVRNHHLAKSIADAG